MSEYQDHVRQSLEGQNVDPGEDLSIDAMRWTPDPVSEDVTDEATQTAADTAHALLDRAADAYLSLLNAVLGDGTHHMVASASTPHGDLTEGQELTVIGDALIIDEAASMRVCAVIAAGMVGCGTGGLVVRTFGPNGSEFVRGWKVRNFWLRPLTAHEIRGVHRRPGDRRAGGPGTGRGVPAGRAGAPPGPGPDARRERQPHRAPGQPAPETAATEHHPPGPVTDRPRRERPCLPLPCLPV